MIQMKKSALIFGTVFALLAFSSCSNDDDAVVPDPTIIPEESLVFLHGDSEKKWRITAYYSSYSSSNLDESFTSCTADDIYTFFADDSNSTVEFGSESCYDFLPNESSSALYTYYSNEQNLYLDFSRGGYSDTENYFELFVLKCILLTEDRMIFTSGGDDSTGTGIVFERVE